MLGRVCLYVCVRARAFSYACACECVKICCACVFLKIHAPLVKAIIRLDSIRVKHSEIL